MYANLTVTVDGTDHRAWAYSDMDGRKIIHLDANDGGKYVVDAGALDVTNAEKIKVQADF